MNTYESALFWHRQGLTCLPCYSGSKSILKGYSKNSQMTIPNIICLFHPGKLNLCLVTGRANDGRYLVVLDFDQIPNWCRWYSRYQISTYSVQTKRGKHAYFWTLEKPQTGLTSEYCEIKSNGAKVMIPPSRLGEFQYYVIEGWPIMTISRIEEVLEVETPPSKKENDAPSVTVNVTNSAHASVTVNVGTSSLTRWNNPIQAIKASLPITWLFPQYEITGSGMTAGKAMAHCPTAAHQNGDRNPSLSLDLNTNRFNCFKPGCPLHLARGGDILDGYQILNGVSLSQAIAELANELGL